MGIYENPETYGGNIYSEGSGLGSLLASAAKFVLPHLGKLLPTVISGVVPAVTGIVSDKMKAKQEAEKRQHEHDMKVQLLREHQKNTDPESVMRKRLENEKLRLELEAKYPGKVLI